MNFKTIRELLDTQHQRYSEKTFMFFNEREQEISYSLLDDVTTVIGNELLKRTKGEPHKIAILLRNCPEFVFTYFACSKTSAVAVPLNFNLKPPEIEYIMNNSESTMLITTPEFYETIKERLSSWQYLKEVFILGDANISNTTKFSSLLSGSKTPISTSIDENTDTAIVYTSGTTGYPKGVILTHRNLLTNGTAIARAVKMTESDRFMCILPLFHVNGMTVTIMAPLCSGGSMILNETFSATKFWETLAKYRATGFSAVPTVYSILLNRPEVQGLDLSSLRFGICGAAPLPVELMRAFEEKFKMIIIEGYGLTEGTCASCVNPIDGTRKPGSIGVPLENIEMKIFDDNDNELEAGKIGEIVSRGPNTMKGYFKNAEATAQTLKNNWLHTGDIGYVDNDGYFYIVDRKKDMIIRGGENIYPREVEEVLYKHPKVLEAAVIGLPDKIWGEAVVAVIVLKKNEIIDEKDIIAFCKERLADYKCPKRVYFKESLPKTATGKIQKQLLKKMIMND